MGWLTVLPTSACGAETTDVKRNSVGICKVMSMAAGDSDTFLIMRDDLSASVTTKSFFGQGESKLVAVFEQLSTSLVI